MLRNQIVGVERRRRFDSAPCAAADVVGQVLSAALLFVEVRHFIAVIDEVLANPLDAGYVAYLKSKLKSLPPETAR